MAYASPSPPRAPDAPTAPAEARQDQTFARAAPTAAWFPAPRDAFKEKAERDAQRKADKAARRRGLKAPALAAALASAPGSGAKEFPSRADVSPHSQAAGPRPKPKLVARSAAPPLIRISRTRPTLTVHINPSLSATTPEVAPPPPRTAMPPPGPGPTAAAAPAGSPLVRKRGGGGGRPPPKPPAAEREKFIDRDLMVGGALASLLLLFLGWNLFGGTKSQVATAPPAPEPVIRVAAAPKPDAFSTSAPVELRPQAPLALTSPVAPAASPTAEASQQAPPPAAPSPEVKTAQAPPVRPAPVAGSACERVRMVKAYFCTASSTLTPDMRSALETELSGWKACLGGAALVVKGYADTRGQSAYNVQLSTARADTLRDFLKTHELKVAEAKGEGQLAGLAPDHNCANQRRVDVSIGDSEPSTECAKPKDAPVLRCGSLAPAADPPQ